MPQINILSDMNWISCILNYHNYDDYHRDIPIIEKILNRYDYKTFLLELVQRYAHRGIENLLIELCFIFDQINTQKFLEMLYCGDDNGNTFIHYISMVHYKKLLLILNSSIKIETIKANNDGNKPSDLYYKSKIKNVFKIK